MDDTVRTMYEQNPLLLFSLYTAVQVQTLERKSAELQEIVDTWKPNADGNQTVHNVHVYYDNFWFWVLGAYEVVRTMEQHKKAVSQSDFPKSSLS